MTKKSLILFSLSIISLNVLAQEVELVKNLVEEEYYANFGSLPPSGQPENLTAAGDLLFYTPPEFTSYLEYSEGTELWVTDGTIEGTRLVKDIHPGPESSFPEELTWINGKLFFSADTEPESFLEKRELFISDGTEEGTGLVKKINNSLAQDSRPHSFIDYNGVALFAAFDYSDQFLYTSDGTEEGTQKLDILPENVILGFGQGSRGIIFADSLLFFAANHPDFGNELWVSDGTKEGTRMLKDIYPGMNGSVVGGSGPRYFTRAGDYVYFSANSPVEGNELWRTDGTEEGTILVKDIKENSTLNNSSNPYPLAAIGNTLFFRSDADGRGNLWKTDGTEEGTVLFEEIKVTYREAGVLGDSIYFNARDQNEKTRLWVSDGTIEGTRQINTVGQDDVYGLSPRNFVTWKDHVYFSATDTISGNEIWKTNGTDEGTGLAIDLKIGLSSDPDLFNAIGDQLLFRSRNNQNQITLWKSDGTADGTIPLKNIIVNPETGIVEMGETAFFQAKESVNGPLGLWKTDGTPEGTTLVKEFAVGNIAHLTAHRDTLYFVAYVDTLGYELWKSDGTSEQTEIAFDHSPGNASTNIRDIVSAGNKLFVHAFLTDTVGFELYLLDSTNKSFKLVKDIYPGRPNGVMGYTYVINDQLYFVANDGVHGSELWKSDGTEEGTMMIKDVFPTSSPVINLRVIGHIDCEFYFIGRTEEGGFEFWKTDGTSEGTIMLEGLYPEAISVYAGFNQHNTLYFRAIGTDGTYQLWKTNGTSEGTSQILGGDELTARNRISLDIFEVIGETLYFSGYSREAGFELFKTTVDTFNCAINPVLVTSITEIQSASCGDVSDGVAELVIEGGTCGYSYSFDNSTFSFGSPKKDGVGVIRLEGLTAGETMVYLQDDNGCQATTVITTSLADQLVISGTAETDEETGTGSITLDVTGGAPPYSYLWSNSDTVENINELEPGEYTVIVTDQAGCSAEASFTIDEITSMIDSYSSGLRIYPNPSAEALNIDIPGTSKPFSINIVDQQGRTRYTKSFEGAVEQSLRINVDEQDLPEGIYMVRILTSEGAVLSGSFIILEN